MLTVNPNLHGLAWPFMAIESGSWVGLTVATISVQDDYMNTYRRTRLHTPQAMWLHTLLFHSLMTAGRRTR